MALERPSGPPVTAVVCDVLGTLLDEDGARVAAVRNALPELDDAAGFARRWGQRVAGAVAEIAARERPFRPNDELEEAALAEVLAAAGLHLPEPRMVELARFGDRIEPFPGVAEAVADLRARFPLLALTNAGLAQMAALSTHLGWEWTGVVSAEAVTAYKPDPRMYRRALEVLGLPASDVLFVAAHRWDLTAAAEEGMRTAYLGADDSADRFDLSAPDLAGLVAQLAR